MIKVTRLFAFALPLIILAAILQLSIASNLRSSSSLNQNQITSETEATRLLASNNGHVPRILHSIVLGQPPKEYMVEYAKFTGKMAKSQGFKHVLWSDHDVDKLIRDADNAMRGIQQTWEYIQQNTGIGRFAMKADFLRVNILYLYGGVYLDADVIVCGELDFFVNTPNVVSFPFFPPGTHEINHAFSSAPPKHRLMEMMLQRIMSHGAKISGMSNLEAAGPRLMGRVADEYFKAHGIHIPPLVQKHYRDNEEIDGAILKDSDSVWDLQIADVRLGSNINHHELYHLEFRSWMEGEQSHAQCFDKPKTIEPFFDYFCAHPQNRAMLITRFDDFCGRSSHQLEELF